LQTQCTFVVHISGESRTNQHTHHCMTTHINSLHHEQTSLLVYSLLLACVTVDENGSKSRRSCVRRSETVGGGVISE
jgi:hypothetical protein